MWKWSHFQKCKCASATTTVVPKAGASAWKSAPLWHVTDEHNLFMLSNSTQICRGEATWRLIDNSSRPFMASSRLKDTTKRGIFTVIWKQPLHSGSGFLSLMPHSNSFWHNSSSIRMGRSTARIKVESSVSCGNKSSLHGPWVDL